VFELQPDADAPVLEAIAEHLRTQGLRPHAWPEQLEVVAALPRTVAGTSPSRSVGKAVPGSVRATGLAEWCPKCPSQKASQ
jgi:non-ribosomal peptide synthetase component E (peptide arylation enzyme)